MAIKVFNLSKQAPGLSVQRRAHVEARFRAEVALLRKVTRANNVVSYVGSYYDDAGRFYILTALESASLDHLIYKAGAGVAWLDGVPVDRKVHVVADVARALYLLHSTYNVLHRDIKSSNVLVTRSWVAKLTDFGLSHVFEDVVEDESASGPASASSAYPSLQPGRPGGDGEAGDTSTVVGVRSGTRGWQAPELLVATSSATLDAGVGTRREMVWL